MSGEELGAFLGSLPAGQATISLMLDFIEDELYESSCDHHLRYAMKFMMDRTVTDAPARMLITTISSIRE